MTTYMQRPLISPIINACIAIAESTGVPVGDGVAPECDRPYIVVDSVISPRYDGPFLFAPEADSSDRIQFACIGDTREQADAVRDSLRTALTVVALDAEFVSTSASRRTTRVILDIPRGVQRDERGLPDPIFSAIDQYMIETTPL